jgi:ABC-type transport system involved in multi-copper enzyme maturation permease subunit
MESPRPMRNYFWRFVVAEVRKIYDFGFPQIASLVMFLAIYLFVFQLFYVEGVTEHWPVPNAYYAVPLLFYATWGKTILIFMFLAAFSVYCVTVESQYGMIRVLCAQPLARWQYVVGKHAAISCHVVLLTASYVLSLFIWATVQAGLRGFTFDQGLSLYGFFSRVLIYSLGVSCISISIALLRKTMISALVTTAFAFFGLALLTMYRSLEFGQYHFVRYYFAAMENLPFPFKWDFPTYPFHTFCLVTLVTCLIFFLPPLLYFQLRDITE